MAKKFLTSAILLTILVGILVPIFTVKAQLNPTSYVGIGTTLSSVAAKTSSVTIQAAANAALGPIIKAVGYLLMTISSLALIFTGWLFDEIIRFSIIEFSEKIGDSKGFGGAITSAWATIRDLSNMIFIFVLLYAAFKAMFDANFSSFFGTTIKNIIIVALLINFSLFATKVVIDASNIVSVGFYNSITNNNQSLGSTSLGGSANFKGISGGYMRMLGLQTWYGINVLDGGTDVQRIFVTSFAGSIFMLLSATIFLVTSIMFASRFIILIFLMILSPLAAITYAIPGQSSYFFKWWDNLKNQALFAPIYFAMTWVAFKLGNALFETTLNRSASYVDLVKNPFQNQTGTMGLLLSYVLITGFSIAALIISKQTASKTMGFNAISGGIATGAMGGSAWVGRQTIGRGANWISETQRDKWSKSRLGRVGLHVADKAKKGSFDIRNSETIKKTPFLGKEMGILGKGGGKDGFFKYVEQRAKRKADYGKAVYGQTELEKAEAKKLEDKYNIEKLAEENRIRSERTHLAENNLGMARLSGDAARIKAAEDYSKEVAYRNKNKIFKDEEYNEAFREGIKKDYEKYAQAGERRIEEFAKRTERSSPILKTIGAVTGGLPGAAIGGVIGGIAGPLGAALGVAAGVTIGQKVGEKIKFVWEENKAASRKIRGEVKGPSKEKGLADAYKAIADSETEATPPPPPPPTPTGTSPT